MLINLKTVILKIVTLKSDSFFFQAEDGIRDGTVTGVQTCALPILRHPLLPQIPRAADGLYVDQVGDARSEERRVGKSVDLGGRRIIKKIKFILYQTRL